MKWVKRGCWIAAWGVWVWCGFGLARELPRQNGPTLAKLNLEDGEWIDRLVVGTSLAVSRSVAPDGERSRRVWDLRTGNVTAESLAAQEDEVDRGFLEQRGPRNEREDLVEISNRYVSRARSIDGRVELNILDNTVKEIASGRIVDAGGTGQPILYVGTLHLEVVRIFGVVPGASIYVSEEIWSERVGATPPILRVTHAIHVLADGRLLFRLQHSLDWVTSDGALSLYASGEVTSLPPPPNYPLLAFCQTILALPIFLLWAVLRWRRRRKAIAQ